MKTEIQVKITKFNTKPGSVKLEFERKDLTGQQYKEISSIINCKESISLTIKTVQGTMFDDDKVDAADNLSAPESKKNNKKK